MENTWNLITTRGTMLKVSAEFGIDGVTDVQISGDMTSLHPLEKKYLRSEDFAEELEYHFSSPFLLSQDISVGCDGGCWFLSI